MCAAKYDAAAGLARAAQRLDGPRGGLPALFAMTDPQRTPDPLALAARLSPGSGLIFRHFGQDPLRREAERLTALCIARGVRVLIAADPELADQVGAHGVHWPNAQLHAAWRWRLRRPGWIFTASAHDPIQLRRAARSADAALLSPVFASQSPSAARALGLWRAAAMARGSTIPVYALGGVDGATVRRLQGLGLAGAAAIGALAAH